MSKSDQILNDGEIGCLKYTWCLWDRYQSNFLANKKNYVEDKEIVFEFSDLQEFAALWNNS